MFRAYGAITGIREGAAQRSARHGLAGYYASMWVLPAMAAAAASGLALLRPEALPVALPIAELSRRFRVSRTHILRLLREAEAEGLLTREGENIVPAPVLGVSLVELFAAVFHIIDQAAAAAIAATR